MERYNLYCERGYVATFRTMDAAQKRAKSIMYRMPYVRISRDRKPTRIVFLRAF